MAENHYMIKLKRLVTKHPYSVKVADAEYFGVGSGKNGKNDQMIKLYQIQPTCS